MAGNGLIREMSRDVVERNLIKEGQRIHSKWAKTGLLEGLDQKRGAMVARLMENQLMQFLREASSTADIIGFQNVAFPIVRRVFAGLIANELVSVQPMSLPSGLLFYMDYRYDSVKGGNQADDFTVGGSLFGDRNTLQDAKGSGGPYNFSPSFSLREKVSTSLFSGTLAALTLADIEYDPDLSSSIAQSATGFKKLTLVNAYAALQASGGLSSPAEIKMVLPVSGSSTSFTTSTDGTPVRVGVTAATGIRLSNGTLIDGRLGPAVQLQVVTPSGTADLRVLELS